MAKVLDEVFAANRAYAAEFGDKGSLALPPARHFAILTCMDARLDPAKFAGLAEGDAHVIRNAGGRASDDAIRSLIISSRLLATTEFAVTHHTDRGRLTFTNDHMHAKLQQETGEDASDIDFLPFPDLEQSVRDDVDRILSTPFLDPSIPVSGY